MSTTSTSTLTRPTNEIDLQETQTIINKARQLPLHVAAFKDAFPEATQNIAQIAENANPEDPHLLKIEVGAIKVGRWRVLFPGSLLGYVARVQMPVKFYRRRKVHSMVNLRAL